MPAKKKRTVQLQCLRSQANLVADGGTAEKKTLLVGFASASDLAEIAKAPSFSETDSNFTIAEMLQKLPANKWQRPLDRDRIVQMAAFFNLGNLMPNPVLLAANPNLQQSLRTAHAGELVKIEVEVDERVEQEGALWILDGQHRIAALAAASTQQKNPVPFVLLLDEDDATYTSSEFAAIFAQVTTKAKPLEEPHHTWLEYSFKLGSFDPPRGEARRQSFETIVWLGSDQVVPGTKTKNHFAGNIRFNPRYPAKTTKVGVEGKDGVFAFPAQDFSKLVYEYYFKKPKGAPLPPRDVAGQIALSYDALKKVISKSQDAVFFRAGNTYIQEGFVVGVLTFLRNHGKPDQWEKVLRRLAFDKGSWELRGRPIDTGGQHGRSSRAAAVGAFQYAFGQYMLPAPAQTFVSFMLGDTAADVHLSIVDASTETEVHHEDISNQTRLELNEIAKRGRNLKVGRDPNIGMIRLQGDTQAPAYYHDVTRLAQSRSGFPLDGIATEIARKKGAAVTITLWAELYGGEARSTKIIFS